MTSCGKWIRHGICVTLFAKKAFIVFVVLDLITSYGEAVDLICKEISRCGEGDRIAISLYIWEPGKSSDCVIEELKAALGRGTQVFIEVDESHVSAFARMVEGTTTYLKKLRTLAKEFPELHIKGGRHPNHSKVYLFSRKNGTSTLMFGSLNLGDRFKNWKDFLVHYESEKIGQEVFERYVLGKDVPVREMDVQPVVNNSSKKEYGITAALEEVFGDFSLDKYLVTTAYIDSRGFALLAKALLRKAHVTLVLPARANVYHNANVRIINALVQRFPNIEVYCHEQMVHAKSIWASGPNGTLSFLGSANLKRNSMILLSEFNGIVRNQDFNKKLQEGIEAIISESSRYQPVRYNRILSRLEELLG